MVGHGVRIATVIGGNHQQIGRKHRGEKRREQRVKFLKRTRESLDIFAMAIEHVEIDEVRENQSAGLASERFV